MKKILTSILLILSLLLVGCSADNDMFAKKEKCQEYLSIMEDKVEIERNLRNHPTEPTVFYSPSLDTCVGTYTIKPTGDITMFYIYDVLTNENIYYADASPDNNRVERDAYKAKQVELKK